MGFFKKIGNAVKKGLKQISLKNAVKIGTPLLGAIPIVGGLVQNTVSGISQAHEMKKEAEKAQAEGKIAEAQALQAQADYIASLSGQKVGQSAGTVFNAFSKGTTEELINTVSQGNKQLAGNVGSAIVDETIKSWFTKHWKKFVIALGVLLSVFLIWKNSKKGQRKPIRKTSYR